MILMKIIWSLAALTLAMTEAKVVPEYQDVNTLYLPNTSYAFAVEKDVYGNFYVAAQTNGTEEVFSSNKPLDDD